MPDYPYCMPYCVSEQYFNCSEHGKIYRGTTKKNPAQCLTVTGTGLLLWVISGD